MTVKFLVTNATIAAPAMAMISARGGAAVFVPISTPVEEVRRVVAEEQVDAIISRTIRIDGATMDASPRLRVISKHGAGTDNIDVEAATARGIPVLFALAGNSRSVAEHALTFMLALVKRIVPLDAALRRGTWPRESYLGVELAGRHLGIVGCGGIGRIMSQLALALGMSVSVYDPHVPDDRLPPEITRQGRLHDLLAVSDVVSLHCPLTKETRNLIGRDELRLMKRSAVLINTARGPIVNEAALIEALREGIIAGAGLDSFTDEPAAPDSPLWSLPNTLYTPHVAGVTAEAFGRVAVQSVENAFAILDGTAPDPRCLVNPAALGR